MKRHRTTGHHLSETALGNRGNAAWEMMHMEDKFKLWTTVGSGGSLNATDLAKVSLHQSIVQLGVDLLPPTAVAHNVAAADVFAAPIPTQQAVVRYNVEPVDGMFPSVTPAFAWALRLRYRGRVTARWIEVDLATGAETQLVQFDSNAFPVATTFHVQAAFTAFRPVDFVKKAYYVEATLVAPALIVGHPAAISIVKLSAEPPIVS
jgi:hypothetical protein